MNGMEMRVFKAKEDKGRNFRIENIEEENILWKDFDRKGNPAKNVPPGGYATFAVKFTAPNAGESVAQQLEELYDVNTRVVVPQDGEKPFKQIKIAMRFDMFPPNIVMHSTEDVVLSHYIQKANKMDKIQPNIVEEFNENVAGLQRIIIDHINVDVNVSNEGKAYVSGMEVWQKLDDFGNPMYMQRPGRAYEEMAEFEHPLDDGEEPPFK